MFLIIVVRAVTMEGAMQGLDAFFKPDWSRIFDGKVWLLLMVKYSLVYL